MPTSCFLTGLAALKSPSLVTSLVWRLRSSSGRFFDARYSSYDSFESSGSVGIGVMSRLHRKETTARREAVSRQRVESPNFESHAISSKLPLRVSSMLHRY
jgi:hypothetical protein